MRKITFAAALPGSWSSEFITLILDSLSTILPRKSKRLARLLLIAWLFCPPAQARPLVYPHISAGEAATTHFAITPYKTGYQVHLLVKARVDFPSVGGGSNPVMVIEVNGQTVADPVRLVNKPPEFFMRDGSDADWAWSDAWRVVFSPNFSDEIMHANLSCGIPDTDPYNFEINITPEVKVGTNRLTIRHKKLLPQPLKLVVQDVRVVTVSNPRAIGRRKVSLPRILRGRSLSRFIVGQRPVRAKFQATLSPQGSINVVVGGRRHVVTSAVSLPGGAFQVTGADSPQTLRLNRPASAGWTAGGAEFRRQVRVHSDRVQVRDTITNLTPKVLGFIFQHRISKSSNSQSLLAGRPVFTTRQVVAEPAHPTVFLFDPSGGSIGMVADDDVFRVHCNSFVEGNTLGLSDGRLGIPGHVSKTFEWSIYPTGPGDYWDFINAVRRNWGANFTIRAPLVFETGVDEALWKHSPSQARWVSIQATNDDGTLAEGSAIPLAKGWSEAFRGRVSRLKLKHPQQKMLAYFHTQISTEPEAESKYRDDRALDYQGEQIFSPYSYPVRIFVPTLSNSYGSALTEALQKVLSDSGAAGIYWDEFSYATSDYIRSPPWDQSSVEVDPTSHGLIRLCSSVSLLKLGWDVAAIDKLRASGHEIVGNGPAMTRSITSRKVPCVVETFSYSHLIKAHLGSPWGLGNHRIDFRVENQFQMTQRILDYGCIFCPYSQPAFLPWVDAMYPLTPTNIRSGVVMGLERIITKRSGLFGWADGSKVEVLLFDSDGKKIDSSFAREKNYVRVALRPGQLAILIRRGAPPRPGATRQP